MKKKITISHLHYEGTEDDKASYEEGRAYSEEILRVHWWVMLVVPVIGQSVKSFKSLIHYYFYYFIMIIPTIIN